MRFLRQYSVGQYILDFYCPEVMVAIELDGGQHNDPAGKTYDDVRTEYLEYKCIHVLRFWNHDVLLNMDGVLAKLQEKV
jgi:very-short-patch-repair endonuclease